MNGCTMLLLRSAGADDCCQIACPDPGICGSRPNRGRKIGVPLVIVDAEQSFYVQAGSNAALATSERD
jgi:hypothetical protein